MILFLVSIFGILAVWGVSRLFTHQCNSEHHHNNNKDENEGEEQLLNTHKATTLYRAPRLTQNLTTKREKDEPTPVATDGSSDFDTTNLLVLDNIASNFDSDNSSSQADNSSSFDSSGSSSSCDTSSYDNSSSFDSSSNSCDNSSSFSSDNGF